MIIQGKKRRFERRKKTLSEEEWLEVETLYTNGHSVNTLCETFNVGFVKMKKYLEQKGILRDQERTPYDQRKKRLEVVKPGKFAGIDFFKR